MEKKTKGGGGFLLYLFILAMAIVAIFAVKEATKDKDNYTYEQFIADLEDGKVESVKFIRNREVPTGKILVHLVDDKNSKSAYVSDTSEVEKLIIEYNAGKTQDVEYSYPDVERDSVFLTTVLPIILIVIAIII